MKQWVKKELGLCQQYTNNRYSECSYYGSLIITYTYFTNSNNQNTLLQRNVSLFFLSCSTQGFSVEAHTLLQLHPFMQDTTARYKKPIHNTVSRVQCSTEAKKERHPPPPAASSHSERKTNAQGTTLPMLLCNGTTTTVQRSTGSCHASPQQT